MDLKKKQRKRAEKLGARIAQIENVPMAKEEASSSTKNVRATSIEATNIFSRRPTTKPQVRRVEILEKIGAEYERKACALLFQGTAKWGPMWLFRLDIRTFDITSGKSDYKTICTALDEYFPNTALDAPAGVKLPTCEILASDPRQGASRPVGLLPAVSQDALEIDPLWTIEETQEEVVSSYGLSCSKDQNSFCTLLMIAVRFKFFRLRLDQLPLRELPRDGAGIVMFLWACSFPRRAQASELLEWLPGVLTNLGKALNVGKMSARDLFSAHYRNAFASVRQISYTAAEGRICPNCVTQSRIVGPNGKLANIVGASTRSNLAEYPPWALQKRTKDDIYTTMSELVEPLFEMEPSSSLSTPIRCPRPKCESEALRRIMVIRDRLPFLLAIGQSVIAALQRAPNASFVDDISVQYCHEKEQRGYACATYVWLGAVYCVKDQVQLFQKSQVEGCVYRWTGEGNGGWHCLTFDDLPQKKHLTVLFYWLKTNDVKAC